MTVPRSLAASEFEDSALGSSVPVLVAFTADWCAPCKWLKPYLEEAAERMRDAGRVFTIDVDIAPDIAARYAVASVPTVVFMASGREVGRSIGVEPERIREFAGSVAST